MSRSTRSSTRTREEKSPARGEAKSSDCVKVPPDPVTDAITSINGLVKSFVDSATEVQTYMYSEFESISQRVHILIHMFENNRDGFENICNQVTHANNKYKNCQFLWKAAKQWQKLIKVTSISSLSTLDTKKKRDVCWAGRKVAASLLFTGNIYPALTILKEVIEIADHDPPTAIILLSWFVRSSEWEAMETLLESDRQKKKSNFEGFEELIELCTDIMEFHSIPKGRDEKAIKLMTKWTMLNEVTDRKFQLFEDQIIVLGALFLVSKVAGIKSINMMDPLYCIDLAFQKAEVIVKSRWTGFSCDKPLDGLNTKIAN
ncbi:hypothetical protein PENTCL1PPCAC_21848, partial [Pristionchus entomophagus]